MTKLKTEKEKAIIIMLDLQGTLDNMTDETAQIFMRQLCKLKTIFSAHKVIINISTHVEVPSPTLDKYMTILARNLKANFLLDDATYLSGTYNFYTKKCQPLPNNYNNFNKTKIFEERYLHNSPYNIVWFGIVDDSLDPNYFCKYQHYRLMAEFIPSLNKKDYKKYDNLMSISSLTNGFLGVIECFDTYINNIKDIPLYNLLEVQRNILPHLNTSDIKILLYTQRYSDILKYLKAYKIDPENYKDIVQKLQLISSTTTSSENLLTIKKIFNFISNQTNPNEQYLLEHKKDPKK